VGSSGQYLGAGQASVLGQGILSRQQKCHVVNLVEGSWMRTRRIHNSIPNTSHVLDVAAHAAGDGFTIGVEARGPIKAVDGHARLLTLSSPGVLMCFATIETCPGWCSRASCRSWSSSARVQPSPRAVSGLQLDFCAPKLQASAILPPFQQSLASKSRVSDIEAL
jgi:hypothetical protein